MMADSKHKIPPEDLAPIFETVSIEIGRATRMHGTFVTFHHGHSVILEELDEMWDAIKANDPEQAIKEAHEVAAMAIRFIYDLGGQV